MLRKSVITISLIAASILGHADPAPADGYADWLVRTLAVHDSYVSRGRNQLALDIIEQARQERPEFAQEPLFLLKAADSMRWLGRCSEAIELLADIQPKTAKPNPLLLNDRASDPLNKNLVRRVYDELPLIVYGTRAKCHLKLDQYDEARVELANFESAVKLWTGPIFFHAIAAVEVAELLVESGAPDEAERLLDRVEFLFDVTSVNWLYKVQINTTVRDLMESNISSAVKRTRGEIAISQSRYTDSIPLFKEAEARAGKFSVLQGRVLLRSRLIHALNRAGRYAEAIENLPTGYGGDEPSGTLDGVPSAELLAEAGYAYLKIDQSKKAIASWDRLVNQLEREQALLVLSPGARQRYFEKWIGFYRLLADTQIKFGSVDRGFELAELTKARSLLETVTAGNADNSDVLPERDKLKLKELNDTILALRGQIPTSLEPAARDALAREEKNAVRQITELRQRLYQQYPRYAALNKINIVTRANADLLPTGSVFVSYMLAQKDVYDDSRGTDLWAFVLRGDGLPSKAIPLGDAAGVQDEVKAYVAALTAPARLDGSDDTARSDELARSLSTKLVAPILSELSAAESLIISPDGYLALLPFETLTVDSQPLVTKFDVSYVQSLSVLALLKERQREYQFLNRRSVFAMGGALYEAEKANPVSTRPTDRSMEAGRRASYVQAMNSSGRKTEFFDKLGFKFSNLPGTENEIRDVVQLFPDSTAYLREDATEDRLLQLNGNRELEKYRYLLFSAHGFLSTQVPELSALVLGQVNRAPHTDGFVTAVEWPTYFMKSDLMVLSACETGIGKIVLGEGVMGLPYALYVAGNRSTVVSLWAVDDEGTNVFMKTFFSHLKAGKGQSAAINATKRDLIKGGRYSHPFFWAPFVMYGF